MASTLRAAAFAHRPAQRQLLHAFAVAAERLPFLAAALEPRSEGTGVERDVAIWEHERPEFLEWKRELVIAVGASASDTARAHPTDSRRAYYSEFSDASALLYRSVDGFRAAGACTFSCTRALTFPNR